MNRPRLCLVDDHAMVREGLARSLAGECEIAATLSSGRALLAFLEAEAVDCVLLDLHMPGENGLEVLPVVRRAYPTTHVIVVTMLVDRRLADEAFLLGAAGYVPKDASSEELLQAIREVMAGGRYRSGLVPKTSHRMSLAARYPGLVTLTPRQHEIFLRLGEGKSWSQVAAELGCAPSTVSFHKQRLQQLLGFQSESGLRRFATLMVAEAPGEPDPS